MATKKETAAKKAATTAARRSVAQTVHPAAGTALAANLPAGIALVRRVTMPALVLKTLGEARYLKILDAFHVSKVEGKEIDQLDAQGKKTGQKVREKPATVCSVIDIQTGEAFTLLVPSVVQKNLEQEYPDADYVGKSFMVTNKGKSKPGNRYFDFEIAEVAADS